MLVSLVGGAKKFILLIDNYVDVGTLNILAKKNAGVSVCIYTLKGIRLSGLDVENFNKQFPTLEVRYTETFHDRFLIIDSIRMYYIGASLKDAGKKCFAIVVLEDDAMTKDILHRLKIITNRT